jgi:hypothetical protein
MGWSNRVRTARMASVPVRPSRSRFPGGTQFGFFLVPNGGDIIAGLPGEFLGGDVQFLKDGGIPSASDLTPPEVVLSSVVKGVNGNISVVGTAVDAPVFFIFDCRTQPIGANLERFRAIFWLCCPSFPSYLDLIRISPGEG